MPDSALTSDPGHSFAAGERWGEVELALVEDGRRAVPAFPLALLPQPWRSWVSETARSAGAPGDYVAQALLGAVAGLCGGGARVRPTPGWSEPLLLWQLVVGRASSGKSPALTSLRAMLGRLEGEDRQDVDKAPPRIVVADPAPDTLAEAVASNPRGVILWRDEATAWLADLGPSWLDSWTGAPPAPDGVGRPVSVLGTMRPEHLMMALAKADSAIAARFLYAWPDPPPYCALADRRMANDDLALELLRKIRRGARTTLDPLVLPLEAAAAKAFDGFLGQLHRDLGLAEGLEADWMGKGSGTVARLAGLLEMLAWAGSDSGNPPTQVRAASVEAAVELWRDYFRPHAAFVLERGGPDDLLGQARRVVHWLRRERRRQVSREEVRCQALHRAVNAERAEGVIGRLSVGNVLRFVSPGARAEGRPPRRWEVNPAVLS